MVRFLCILGVIAGCTSDLAAQTATGDAGRGEQLLRDRGCIICHKIEGHGGDTAPDLASRISRNYTPAHLVSVIWNHIPRWQATLEKSRLSDDQAADLYAFFVSRRYFELPGDAGRGKRVFVERRCAACHGIAQPDSAEANPIAAWRSLRDPIAFAQEMWNRPQVMVQAMARQAVHYRRLTPQDVTDLLVYLENLPLTRGKESRFRLAPVEAGHVLFQAKGCAGCHQGNLSLENRIPLSMMANLSAAMWNHALIPVERRPPLSYNDMSGLVSYMWSMQDQGDRRRGRRVFFRMRCAACHDHAETAVHAEPQGLPVRMIAALWNEGPAMQAEMRRKGFAWPRFADSELANLAAYMKTWRFTVHDDEVSHGSAAGIDHLSRIRDYR